MPIYLVTGVRSGPAPKEHFTQLAFIWFFREGEAASCGAGRTALRFPQGGLHNAGFAISLPASIGEM
jgi:hypothetical protein